MLNSFYITQYARFTRVRYILLIIVICFFISLVLSISSHTLITLMASIIFMTLLFPVLFITGILNNIITEIPKDIKFQTNKVLIEYRYNERNTEISYDKIFSISPLSPEEIKMYKKKQKVRFNSIKNHIIR